MNGGQSFLVVVVGKGDVIEVISALLALFADIDIG
jgi:hypothetical protein